MPRGGLPGPLGPESCFNKVFTLDSFLGRWTSYSTSNSVLHYAYLVTALELF